jgi:hypothetical protein
MTAPRTVGEALAIPAAQAYLRAGQWDPLLRFARGDAHAWNAPDPNCG